ncbi:MAG: radical SAM protein [Anaerolineae bacterium]|jgi:uncharacterized protein|nr:radical SAM protein [Anaerolineae bacterium]
MADEKPVLMTAKPGDAPEGDCACPEPDRFSAQLWRASPADVPESDCACPEAASVPDRHNSAPSGLWQQTPGLYRAPLSGGHEVAFAPVVGAGVVVLNGSASRLLDAFAYPRPVPRASHGLPMPGRVEAVRLAGEMAGVGLISRAGETAAAAVAPPQTLTAWLHVTRRCNLHCTYCYAGRGEEEMDEATARATVEALCRSAARHGLRALKLKYAGGEPSLNLPAVLAAHGEALTRAERHGLALREVLLTNGVNLPVATLEALRGAGIGLSVSLDGVGPVHDGQRGAGSFERALRSLDLALSLGMRPHVSVTVTAHNVHALREVVELVMDRGLPFNLNFYRPSGRSGSSSLQPGEKDLIAGVRAALAAVEERLPRESLVAGLLDRCSLAAGHLHACGAGKSYVAIDPEGRLASCHMELDGGRIVGRIGRDDPLSAIRMAAGAWRAMAVDERPGCGQCEWRYWCAGGCPLLSRLDAGPSPYCRVYRAIIPELLRLEGLRLLKWGPDS